MNWTDEDLARHKARMASVGRSSAKTAKFIADSLVRPRKRGRSRANTASGEVEKVWRDGILFDSLREADRWTELRLLEKAGEIVDLEHHRRWPLVVNNRLVCQYESDFSYEENGKLVVEDAKGHRTEVYKLKRKLFHAVYGFEIQEV